MKRISASGVILLTLISWGIAISAQTSHSSSETADQRANTPRPDDWRRVPKMLAPEIQDSQNFAMLKARGEFFDQFNKTGVPLDQPTPQTNIGHGHSWSLGPQSEFPRFPGETVVVAKFEDYRVYLTPSHLSAYTDINLSVEQVLAAGPKPAQAGQPIDCLEFGADIQLPDGRTIMNVPYEDFGKWSLQPGHRYALILEYHTKGDFYTAVKYWELEGGFAVPVFPDDIARAQSGQSKYAGMREEVFINTLLNNLDQNEPQN